MRALWPKNCSAALVLLGALWSSCSGAEAPANGAGSAGAGGAGGAAPGTQAGSGGTAAATAGSAGTGAGAATGTCALACDHAVACLTAGALCPELTAQDAGAVAAACHEICAALPTEFEALSEHADRCGLALSAVVDNSDLASRPNRDVVERCAPSEACQGVCDTVGSCAANRCENLGAVGSAIFSACIEQCTAGDAWIASVNAAQNASGCPAALDAYDAARPGTLPAGCAGRD